MSYNSKYTGAEVDAALDLAKTSLQEHQDISGKQDIISDLADIRSGAAKGATALQSVPSEYVTETELTNKGYASTVSFTNLSASSWVSDSTYEAYPYRCDLTCSGVTDNDYAEVVFDVMQATSGVYAPVCRTSTDIVSIWASENTTITVPTIIITR